MKDIILTWLLEQSLQVPCLAGGGTYCTPDSHSTKVGWADSKTGRSRTSNILVILLCFADHCVFDTEAENQNEILIKMLALEI